MKNILTSAIGILAQLFIFPYLIYLTVENLADICANSIGQSVVPTLFYSAAAIQLLHAFLLLKDAHLKETQGNFNSISAESYKKLAAKKLLQALFSISMAYFFPLLTVNKLLLSGLLLQAVKISLGLLNLKLLRNILKELHGYGLRNPDFKKIINIISQVTIILSALFSLMAMMNPLLFYQNPQIGLSLLYAEISLMTSGVFIFNFSQIVHSANLFIFLSFFKSYLRPENRDYNPKLLDLNYDSFKQEIFLMKNLFSELAQQRVSALYQLFSETFQQVFDLPTKILESMIQSIFNFFYTTYDYNPDISSARAPIQNGTNSNRPTSSSVFPNPSLATEVSVRSTRLNKNTSSIA